MKREDPTDGGCIFEQLENDEEPIVKNFDPDKVLREAWESRLRMLSPQAYRQTMAEAEVAARKIAGRKLTTPKLVVDNGPGRFVSRTFFSPEITA